MRVLFINNLFPPDYVGGAEISAFYSAYGLIKKGYDVSVLAVFGRAQSEAQQDYVFHGIPVHKATFDHRANNGMAQIMDPAICDYIQRRLESSKPDLVHIHNVSGTSLAPFVACRNLGIPVVVTLHDYWLLCPNNMLLRAVNGLCDPASSPALCHDCYKRYDFWGNVPSRRKILSGLVSDVKRFISPSQCLVDLHVRGGYSADRFRVLKSGIDLSLFQSPVSASLRQVIDENVLHNSMLFAGHIVEIKGLHVLEQALPIVARYVPDFRLVIAGGGDESMVDSLRRRAPDAVIYLGKLPFYELRPVYASTKLTVVPSIWYDNSPIVIYESLLMGTPVLASSIGGIPELIADQETGYLFAAGDAAELAAKAIDHFAKPAMQRRAMRRQCAEYAAKNLTLDVHVDRLVQIYDEALAED